MNKEEKTGLFETFLELKSPGHRIFPYVSYATWENRYSQSGSSEIALGGIGIRSSKHPQVSDLYVQGNVGAGLIFGKNQERFAGGNHMFQVKVAAIYQLNRHLSVRAGLTHYSNGNILIQGNKRDIARNFFTVGMGYQF